MNQLPAAVTSWLTGATAAIALLTSLLSARSSRRQHRKLEGDLLLLGKLPRGAGREALERSVDLQAQRIASRELEGFGLDPLRFVALLGTSFLVLASATIGMFLLWRSLPDHGSMPRWVEAMIAVSSGIVVTTGMGLLYAGGIVWVVRWVLGHADDHVKRIVTLAPHREQLRDGLARLRNRTETGSRASRSRQAQTRQGILTRSLPVPLTASPHLVTGRRVQSRACSIAERRGCVPDAPGGDRTLRRQGDGVPTLMQ